MKNILGLKVSDDNIAWSLLEYDGDQYKLEATNVHTFQKGVNVEKTGEVSRSALRSEQKRMRKNRFRTRLRKIKLLKILSNHNFCPKVSDEDLKKWKLKKEFPLDKHFLAWLNTNNQQAPEDRKKDIKNPYYFRNLAASEKIDLSIEENRYMIGRAFLHMAQRRGYKTNRKEGSDENDGKVKQNILKITQEKGLLTLGQYFYEKYKKGEKVRGSYTSRNDHYLEEFNLICEKQELPKEIAKEIRNALFFQRPLQVKKQFVGKCPYEKKKYRCAISHPTYEKFRMMSVINNIKIKSPDDNKFRNLTEDEKSKIKPLFFRSSKPNFDFEDIAKKLSPKKKHKYQHCKDIQDDDWLFNFDLKQTISGCPVTTNLKNIFGDDCDKINISHMRKNKTQGHYNLIDIWHVLLSFDDEQKLIEIAKNKWQLNEGQINKLCKIKLPSGYANISLKAMRKILGYLQKGFVYSHAVFMANLEEVIPANIWNNARYVQEIEHKIREIIENHEVDKIIVKIVNVLISESLEKKQTLSKEAIPYYKKDIEALLNQYDLDGQNCEEIEKKIFDIFQAQMKVNRGKGAYASVQRIDDKIKLFLIERFSIVENLDKLYHPSIIESEFSAERGHLPDPNKIPIKNPVYLRAIHQMRKLLHRLKNEKLIDQQTIIRLHVSSSVYNKNQKKAIGDIKKQEAKQKDIARKDLMKLTRENREVFVDDQLVEKYLLWIEQSKKCAYTGENISLTDLVKPNKYQIDYIIPLEKSFNINKDNMVLASTHFINYTKKDHLIGELDIADQIKERYEAWNKKIYAKSKQLEMLQKQARMVTSPAAQSSVTIKIHKVKTEWYYLLQKYRALTRKSVSETHKYSITYDDSLHGKYTKKYLESFFDKVHLVSEKSLGLMKANWGVAPAFGHLEGSSYFSNCCDAIVAGCINHKTYKNLEQSFHEGVVCDKPWPTIIPSLKKLESEIVPTKSDPVDLLKKSKKVLRLNGQCVKDKKGNLVLAQSDSVRGSLHLTTFYGAIKTFENGKQTVKYTIRKDLAALSEKDIESIVDEGVKRIVKNGKKQEKILLEKINELKQQIDEEKEGSDLIKSHIEDIEDTIPKLYTMTTPMGKKMIIKKVKIFARTKNPIPIKKHSLVSQSKFVHKNCQYTVNESNYRLGIYEGFNDQKKIKRSSIIINNFEAVKRLKNNKNLFENKIINKDVEMSLVYSLGTNDIIIFYENDPDEIWNIDPKSLYKRIYKITGISMMRQNDYEFGMITCKHINQTQATSTLGITNGVFLEGKNICPARKMNHNQFKALIVGVDCKIDIFGKISPIIS